MVSWLEVNRVNDNWTDGESLGKVKSFSATRTIESEAPEIDSGDLEVSTDFINEGYVRAWLCKESSIGYTREAIGTYLLESKSGTSIHNSCELWSVLHPAAERIPPVGYYIPKGSDIAVVACELLSECIDAPVSGVEVSDALSEHVVAAEGDTYLSLIWSILGDRWGISIDGEGRVSVRENPTTSIPLGNDDLTTEPNISWDLANIPNVITVTDGTRSVTAINDREDSPTSTVNRKRQIDATASSSEKNDAETLEAYAFRLLEEKSITTQTAEYERDYRSDISTGDIVTLPERDGMWTVKTQRIEFNCALKVSETSVREVSTYAQL